MNYETLFFHVHTVFDKLWRYDLPTFRQSKGNEWRISFTDRVNKNDGRPQIYGTQWVQDEGKFLLYPVEDIEHLDERRSEMGLSTFEEYKRQFQGALQLNHEDKKDDTNE